MNEGKKFEKTLERKPEKERMEVDEVKFEDLEKGDRLIVETGQTPEGRTSQWNIDIVKMPKTREGKIKHLIVEFKEPDEGKDVLIAEMPGGMRKIDEKYRLEWLDYGKREVDIPEEELKAVGPTPRVIRKGEQNCLSFEFENVNYRDQYEQTKSGKRRIKYCKSIRTTPVRKIVVVKEEGS